MKPYRAAALVLVCLLGASQATAQTLTVRNDHFEVNGAPRFLTFISYFDAMRRANAGGGTAGLAADFAFFQGKIDGVRILVNWCVYPSSCGSASDTLIDSNGAVRDSGNWSGSGMNPWARFIAVLNAAQTYGLLVNVTFDRDTIAPTVPSVSTFSTGIYNVIHKLETDYPGQYRNVFFDMQNEWPIHGVTNANLQTYITAAKNARSDAIVTGSQTSNVAPSTAASNAVTDGFTILTYHDARDPGWQTESTIATVVSGMRSVTSMPIGYDEPSAYCTGNVPYTCHGGDDSTLSHFVDAAQNAKKTGVALWTFHTRQGFDLATSDYVTKASASEKNNLASIRDATRGHSWGIAFTDPGLSAGYSVKPVHIYELRARINELRARFGLSAGSYTDTTLTPGSTNVKAAHINDLRTALNGAYVASGRSAPSYAEAISAGSTTIKASHVTELRGLVVYLEDQP